MLLYSIFNGGLCSARLRAGMCLNPQCRPEGRRYKSVSRTGCHADSKAALSAAFFVRAEALTHSPRIAANRGLQPISRTQRWTLFHELCLWVAVSAATFESMKSRGFSP